MIKPLPIPNCIGYTSNGILIHYPLPNLRLTTSAWIGEYHKNMNYVIFFRQSDNSARRIPPQSTALYNTVRHRATIQFAPGIKEGSTSNIFPGC